MVGRRNTFLVTKRSLRNSDLGAGKRPRRTIQTKILDDTVGMSRREEQELNKALYASLQENRRSKSMTSLISPASSGNNSNSSVNRSSSTSSKTSIKGTRSNNGMSTNSASTTSSTSSKVSHSSKSSTFPVNRRQSLRSVSASPTRLLRRNDLAEISKYGKSGRASPYSAATLSATPGGSFSIDESSQDSIKSSASSHAGSKRKIHAQRKFAQGCSLPGMASCTPARAATPAVKMMSSKIPKTEDFLTFLCLRGSSILPPHLDFFNFTREEMACRDDGSKPVSSPGKLKQCREGTPDSSSTSSGANEEVAEAAFVTTPTTTGRSGSSLLAKRSAARASAGTPETARGIVSLRQGLQRKRSSPLGAFTPVTASSPCSSKAGRSGSLTKTKSPGSQTHPRRDTAAVRSARKSLFGKVASAAQQQAKKIVGRSTGRPVPSWKGSTKVRARESQRDGESERKAQKRKSPAIRRKDEGRKAKIAKKSTSGIKQMSRRISTRLRDMAKSTKIGRVRSGSYKADEVDGGKHIDISEKHEINTQGTLRKKEEKAEATKTNVPLPSRRPYKIRPVERVRTRGYSLLLASKLALKRAKKESVTLKQKNGSDSVRHIDKGNKSTAQFQGDNSGRNRRVGERKLSSSVSETETEETGQREKVDRPKAADGGSEPAVVTRRSRDGQDKSKSSKGPSPKKSKASAMATSSYTYSSAGSQYTSIPTFHPLEQEFSDPLAYISKIQPLAEPYGMCKIVPPPSWKLDSTKINEDIRFTSQVQHVHRLCKRWGPNVQHSAAINHHLLSELSNSNVNTTPQIGGVEIDLPQLYQLVEEAGGPRKMADKKHWARIADIMNIPKQAMDRTMRLYDIYCRHVFPYASLSAEERKQLEEEVKAIHQLQTVEDDAVIKGKSMSIGWFSKIARNVHSMWFKEEPSPSQVEAEYWRIVEDRNRHVAVQCGHVNTRAQASAFPTRRDSVYSRHAWNLNNVPENTKCVLKYLGLIAGITIPTLHMGMLFSTSCWSTDLHCLPYIQYLHSGAELIWYCIPKSEETKFSQAMRKLVPSLVTDKPHWLKEDCVMVTPRLFREKDIKVSRCVQRARQFVVVFPGAYTSTISCGYNVAESVHFATTSWLPLGMEASLALTASGEKELFSLSSLLCGLVQDEEADAATLTQALPILASVVSKEVELRSQLTAAGLVGEKSDVFIEITPASTSHRKRMGTQEEEKVCEICDRVCHLSMVLNEQDEQVLCLEHGLKHVHRKKNLKSTRLFLRYSQVELEKMVKEAKDRLNVLNKSDQGISSQGSKARSASK